MSEPRHIVLPVNRAELAEWLRGNTREGDTLASDCAAETFLATGRQTRPLLTITDPFAVQYGKDRKWWTFYAFSSPSSESDRLYEQVRTSFGSMQARGGIDYLIYDENSRAAGAMVRFIRENRASFRPVFVTARKAYVVLAVGPPSTRPAPTVPQQADR